MLILRTLSDEVIPKAHSETVSPTMCDGGGNLVEGPMLSSILTEAEIEASRQRREHDSHFVKTYRKVSGHDPGDGEFFCHTECKGRHDIVSWVNPGDHHRADEMDDK
ncbi:unnamed protein product [Vicia faba]|uniref:Uncharacterized protein n=1 Tax=Vicia faba TaxID=3906 RepID=A0AAV1A120_VICFA|nr:unnamed protein product [Vicia faba]